MIRFSEKNRNLNFVNLFLKCENYHKSRFYEQILKFLLLENSFSFSYDSAHVFQDPCVIEYHEF
ncbi:hypothetical protein LEP1GSC043_2339 [Leptospira weilii str. Ecochallenge]|uniref:Uncharacterized protein n=1 Tax=Leptospira weilii str. Ecochallenge TaxID=1049986 RepID=N1U6Y2_9LEPT|nr:hypothetical protein LEP1GSC043_2339 [Leptospira weilii str. Ecochallenge]